MVLVILSYTSNIMRLCVARYYFGLMRRERWHFTFRFNQTKITLRKCDCICSRRYDLYTLTRHHHQRRRRPPLDSQGSWRCLSRKKNPRSVLSSVRLDCLIRARTVLSPMLRDKSLPFLYLTPIFTLPSTILSFCGGNIVTLYQVCRCCFYCSASWVRYLFVNLVFLYFILGTLWKQMWISFSLLRE